jgi:hypothetical protein
MKSGAENRFELLFRDTGGERSCSERIHVVNMRNIRSRRQTTVGANRSLFGNRRIVVVVVVVVVVVEELVLANESDVYSDPKGSSGYEQGSDEKDDLYKPQ